MLPLPDEPWSFSVILSEVERNEMQSKNLSLSFAALCGR